MKKYFIGALIVLVLYLGSLIYRQQCLLNRWHIPIPAELNTHESQGIHILLYFSEKDCQPCLSRIIEVLNHLPAQFQVAGIVQQEELQDERKFRERTGIKFPLYANSSNSQKTPRISPTLVVLSPLGEVVYLAPGMIDVNTNLRDIFSSLYLKLYPSIKENKLAMRDVLIKQGSIQQ